MRWRADDHSDCLSFLGPCGLCRAHTTRARRRRRSRWRRWLRSIALYLLVQTREGPCPRSSS